MSEKNEIFACNLKALRLRNNWTQDKAAEFLYIKRSQYASWEEGRGFPDALATVVMMEVMEISNWRAFISQRDYAKAEGPKERSPVTVIQQKYDQADIRVKLAVNILLGLVELD